MRNLLLFTIGAIVTTCSPNKQELSINDRIKSERTKDKKMEERIDSVLSLLSLEEKAGQMLHICLFNNYPSGDSTLVNEDTICLSLRNFTPC